MSAKGTLARLIRWVMRDVTYQRRYSATIERDRGDGTFDLMPDDPAMRGTGLQAVPGRVGVAGAEVRVEPGTRCVFAFADADPAKPCIVAWEYTKGSAVVSVGGGHAQVARKGDLVDVLLGTPTPIAGIVQGMVTPPAPAVPFPLPPTPFTGTGTLSGPVRAVIVGGAPRVKA